MRNDLVGIGNPVYDLIKTPKVSTSTRILSGCSTNACLAARKLGMPRVALVGNVGKDFKSTFDRDMKRFGIEGLIPRTSGETGGFSLVYDGAGNRELSLLGRADVISEGDIPEAALDSRYLLVGPILSEVGLNVISFLRKSTKARLFLDPQGLIRTAGRDGRIIHSNANGIVREACSLVDFVKPNEYEAKIITGESDPYRALRILADWGAPVVIITLAERGSILFADGEEVRVPAFKTEAIDPTGAGDVYGGSFLFALSRGQGMKKAAVYASAAASVMVENVGPEFPLSDPEATRRAEILSQSHGIGD